MDNTLPKKIWFLWLTGLDGAPLVVRKCYESWVKYNPGWEIILLDENNISHYMPQIYTGATKQALSDILRINLLAKHGGIWADATTFCAKPLDEWLYDYMPSGFFAFNSPGPDRMISSWFIASEKYNYIASTYQNMVNVYWKENPGMVYIENSRWKKFNKFLERRNRKIWFSFFVTNVLKVYPYFWFHFLFENIYLRDNSFKEMWDATPKFSADIPHKLQFDGLFKPLTEEVKAEIDNKISPVYKLSWKLETPANITGTIIDHLYKTL